MVKEKNKENCKAILLKNYLNRLENYIFVILTHETIKLIY